jgi:hypothetical protein
LFIAALGGLAAWPFAAHAQRSPIPVIGFLSSRTEQQAELAGVHAGESGRGEADRRVC